MLTQNSNSGMGLGIQKNFSASVCPPHAVEGSVSEEEDNVEDGEEEKDDLEEEGAVEGDEEKIAVHPKLGARHSSRIAQAHN